MLVSSVANVPSCGGAGGWRAAALATTRPGTGTGASARTAASAAAAEAASRTIELQRLPRTQPVANLLGKLRRIGGGAEGVGRQDSRRLMVLSPACALGTHRDDDVGPQRRMWRTKSPRIS